MPNGNHAELRRDPGAVPLGVLLGRRADVPLPKVDLSVRTERIELGHEKARTDAFADVMKQVDGYRGMIVLTPEVKKSIARVVADFALAVIDADAAVDPTLPAKASVDGYKKALGDAKDKVLARMSELAADSWEKYES